MKKDLHPSIDTTNAIVSIATIIGTSNQSIIESCALDLDNHINYAHAYLGSIDNSSSLNTYPITTLGTSQLGSKYTDIYNPATSPSYFHPTKNPIDYSCMTTDALNSLSSLNNYHLATLGTSLLESKYTSIYNPATSPSYFHYAKSPLDYSGMIVSVPSNPSWLNNYNLATLGINQLELRHTDIFNLATNPSYLYNVKSTHDYLGMTATVSTNPSWLNNHHLATLGINQLELRHTDIFNLATNPSYLYNAKSTHDYLDMTATVSTNPSWLNNHHLATLGISQLNVNNYVSNGIINPDSTWVNKYLPSTNILSEVETNHSYYKHSPKDLLELYGSKIDPERISFYSNTKASKASTEKALIKILSSLKLKPDHIGFEHSGDRNNQTTNIFIFISSPICGKNVQIGDNITYIYN